MWVDQTSRCVQALPFLRGNRDLCWQTDIKAAVRQQVGCFRSVHVFLTMLLELGELERWDQPEVVDSYRSLLRVGAARRFQTLRHRLLIPKGFKPLMAKTESDENTQRIKEGGKTRRKTSARKEKQI